MAITYRLITKPDLNQVVYVHKIVFRHYFLTSLGDDLLYKYYDEFLLENPELFFGAFDGDSLVGFSLGLYHDSSKATELFEKKYKKQLARRLLLLCLRLDPKAISRCFKFIFSRKAEQNEVTNRGTYLVFGVLPSHRGENIASALTYFLCKSFASNGVQLIYTATNVSNKHTNDFWKMKNASFVYKEGGHNYYSILADSFVVEFEKKHGPLFLENGIR
jgi:ribosomal protein S18 acetylase RimI-like enzyme